jgi:hypothetical protein
MSTPDQPAGHGTEQRTAGGSQSPQSPESAQGATSGAAPQPGESVDVSFRTEGEPGEELAVGEDVDAASPTDGAVEPPD